MSNPKFVRNEVTYITNEIDYDKLAEAMLKALNNNAENAPQKTYTSKMLGNICSIIFRIVGIFGFVIFIMLIAGIFLNFNLSQYVTENGILIPYLLFYIMFFYVFLLVFYQFFCLNLQMRLILKQIRIIL